MSSFLLVLLGITIGYIIAIRRVRKSMEGLLVHERPMPAAETDAGKREDTAEHVAANVRESPKSERDYLNLLDELTLLQRLRRSIIERVKQGGDPAMLKSDEMRELTRAAVHRLELVISREPSGYFRKLYEELAGELGIEPVAHPAQVQDRRAYDAAYSPEQRERNRKQLDLMDEFASLQRRRSDLIRTAGNVGYEILDGEDMRALKIRTIAVLEELIVYETAGFYRDTYDALIAETHGWDDTIQ